MNIEDGWRYGEATRPGGMGYDVCWTLKFAARFEFAGDEDEADALIAALDFGQAWSRGQWTCDAARRGA